MKNERLLVVPLMLPGDVKREEIYRAINFQLYEIFGDKITFLDFEEEFELYKFLYGQPDIIKDCSWYCNGYKELKERHLEILSDVDNVLIYGIQVPRMPISHNYINISNLSNIENIKTELNKCHRKDNYGFVNIGTKKKLKNMLSRMVFIETLGEVDVNVFHYHLDPREIDLSFYIGKDRYHKLGALKSNVGPLKPIPFFEWGIENTYIQDVPKEKDFYCYTTITYKDRFRYREIAKKFNSCLSRKRQDGNRLKGRYEVCNIPDILSSVDKSDASKVVDQSIYYYNLKLSRYTFVNVPILTDTFNYQKFMEAIILDCIPFIDDKMNLEDLRLTYPEFYDIIIKDKLIINTDMDSYGDIANRIKKYSENGDKEIINKFKSTKAYQALMNKDKIKECWRKKLRWKDV